MHKYSTDSANSIRNKRITSAIFTHAGCIAADVGRAFSRVCLCVCLFVHAL